ncbi:MAG: serine hydrolase domain-containing protein [Polymorphobacter sp.]|uniref:serine hydrolase domain-containing protein n=1 Tax=Polymorphobacter sp. TaxID=1909290 RepID=UPI003A885EE5
MWLRLALAAGLTAALAGCAAREAAAPTVAMPPAAAAPSPEMARMMARMQAMPMTKPVESPEAYTPAETVKGGAGAAFETVSAAAAGLSPAGLAAAQAYADAQASFALIVAKGGRIVHEHYAEGFGPDSKFATASMHKAVVALAYGAAIKAGKLSLDDRLDRHLTEFSGRPEGAITLRQLLQMAGGLNPPPGDGKGAPPLFAQLMFAEDIRAAAAKHVQVAPAGTVFSYSNASTQLAGMALEAALGEPYGPWLSRTLWAPLGAGDAEIWLDREGGNPHFFCCLQARPRDWLRVGELLRLEGRVGTAQVVDADWVRTVTAPSPLNPNFGMNIWRGAPHAPLRGYGLGVALKVAAEQPFARDDAIYIDGAGGQRVYVVPSEELVIIRIGKPSTNWDNSTLVNLVLGGAN